MQKIKTYLSGGGNLSQTCLFASSVQVVGRHLFVDNTSSISARSLVVLLAEVGSSDQCRLA